MQEKVIKKVLPTVKDFKKFWTDNGHFKYALCATDFPDYLLEPEEWLFSNDPRALLEELTGWRKEKLKIVNAPVSKKKKEQFMPENISDWRIDEFPETWVGFKCSSFTDTGYLTTEVVEMAEELNRKGVEAAFFKSLEKSVDGMGYHLFGPMEQLQRSDLEVYLKEWREDEELDGGFD